jgi:hypothetical protein
MNFDGKVDLTDFGEFKALYPGAFAEAQGVPEPATIGLVLCILGLVAVRSLRTRAGKAVVV